MKNLLFAFCCCLMPVTMFCQAVPCKKCNTIILKSELPASDLYRAVLKNLVLKGYGLENQDAGMMILETDFKEVKNLRVKFFVLVEQLQNGSVLYFRGKYRSDFGESEIDFRGMKGSPALRAWELMNEFAKVFEGSMDYAFQ